MPDIRLVQNTFFPKYNVTIDWLLLSDGTLDDSQALASAVVVALGSDRLAGPSDVLPDLDSSDRRGWWGDLEAEEIWDGWPLGTRLWLMQRERITGPGALEGATTARVEQYVREAIQPLLDRRVGSDMDIQVTRIDKQRIDVLLRIYRGPTLEVELRYAVLWEGVVAASGKYDIGQPISPI